jgi:lysophospholipase L1-like esterase
VRSAKSPARRLGTLTAIVLALTVLTGCTAANASSGRSADVSVPAAAAGPRTTTVVGDSLTVLGEQPVRSALSDAGWFAALDAFPGRTTATQMDALRAAAARENDATVIELGTNDALAIAHGERTFAQTDADIVRALDLFGDRCIVWVLPDHDPERRGVNAGAGVDAIVAREASRRDNLHVADLAAILDEHPEYLVPDRVHLTAEGYEALAALMAETLSACT